MGADQVIPGSEVQVGNAGADRKQGWGTASLEAVLQSLSACDGEGQCLQRPTLVQKKEEEEEFECRFWRDDASPQEGCAVNGVDLWQILLRVRSSVCLEI